MQPGESFQWHIRLSWQMDTHQDLGMFAYPEILVRLEEDIEPDSQAWPLDPL
jgi:hypothetical protein